MTFQNSSVALNLLHMESGKAVTRINTITLANLLFNNPNVVYGFTTTLHDVHEDITKTVYPWPYFHVTNIRMIDTQIIYMNRSCAYGSAPYVFEIPSFDLCHDINFSDDLNNECLEEITSGLTTFNFKYGELPDTWYLTNNSGLLSITYSE